MRPLLILLALLGVALAPVPVVAGAEEITPGIGISGSLYTLDGITIPQGGSINTSEVYIVVYSYYKERLLVNVTVSAPEGITVRLLGANQSFYLDPGETKRMRVVIEASETTLPGRYRIVVAARGIVNATGPGPVKVLPAVAMSANISVTGEYGVLVARALDPQGNIVENALIRVYTAFRGREQAILDSYGVLQARVLPGNYTIRAYLAGDLVAEERVYVGPFETRTVNLTLKVVFIKYFSVEPIFGEDEELLSARVFLTVKNVYKTINDTYILISIHYNGEPLENRTILSAGTLPIGVSTFQTDYVPPGGWRPGNYTFRAYVLGFGNRTLAVSDEVVLTIRAGLLERLLMFPNILLIVLAAVLAVALAIAARKRRRR